MKFAITFIICCLAVALAEKPNEGSIHKYLDECKKEVKISEADLHDSKKDGCFLVCMYKKQGYMRADSTFDLETLVNLHPDESDKVKYRKFLEQAIEECTKLGNGGTCVLAKCFSDKRYN